MNKISKSQRQQLKAAGVYASRIVQTRRDSYGSPDYLIEAVDQSGHPLRGWWKEGESASDIRWEVERIDGWPESVRTEPSTKFSKRAPSTYYVRVGTYWQNSPDYFVGPFSSRHEAQSAIDRALEDPASKATLAGRHPVDAKYGIRIHGILSKSQAERIGMKDIVTHEWTNIISRIPGDTGDLSVIQDEGFYF